MFAREICYIAFMQPIARRLIVVAAVLLSGAAAGVALGDFAAGSRDSYLPGVDAAMGLAAGFVAPADSVSADPVRPALSGPSSYSCEGCDAKLHNEMLLEDGAFADSEPLPPYQPVEAALPQPPLARPAVAPAVPVQVPAITLPVLKSAATARSTPEPATVPGGLGD